MIKFQADEQLEKIGLSENDFFYSFDTDTFYHWSGICASREALAFPTSLQQFRAELDQHLEGLPDKEDRLAQFRLYQKHYAFVCEFKDWLLNKIIDETGLESLDNGDFEGRQQLYREKRREYITGWEQGQMWNAKDLTDKVPVSLKQATIEAWDFVLSYQAELKASCKIAIEENNA